MRILKSFGVAFCIAFVAISAFAAPTAWNVDAAHSSVEFSVRHFVSQVPGRFNRFSGAIQYDPRDSAACRVDFSVEISSIDTNNGKRDEHLRSADFFDAANHPTATFTSETVTFDDARRLWVTGVLNIRGVGKRLTIPVELTGVMETEMGPRAGFASEFTINRKDFGVSWNRVLDRGGAVLGDDVRVRVNVEAVEQKPAAKPAAR